MHRVRDGKRRLQRGFLGNQRGGGFRQPQPTILFGHINPQQSQQRGVSQQIAHRVGGVMLYEAHLRGDLFAHKSLRRFAHLAVFRGEVFRGKTRFGGRF